MNIVDTKINGGFWKKRKELNKNTSLFAVMKSFEDTGRVRAMTGDNDPVKQRPHIFWESDLAKLMEGAFFSIQQEKDEDLEKKMDSIIDKIIANQEEDGYLNYFFSRHEPDNKFTNLRDRHELYCAGHLLESAIEHHKATGNSKFFDAMERYVDHIITKFGREEGKMRGYPGHQEIELALVKAYEHTNDKKFLDLATYFIDERGTHSKAEDHYYVKEKKKLMEKEGDIDVSKLPSNMRDFMAFDADFMGKTFRDLHYWQAHEKPVDQKTAEGHSVRALYMFTAMADLARLNNDSKLLNACKTLWRNIVDKRMYVHSGVGSAHIGERFTYDYDLPNDMAYAETCATIALIYFANRMSKLELNSEYGDIIENSLYNLLLASTSLDGEGFFYDNYLECVPGYLHSQGRRHGVRDKYHMCSCCPPNITRLFASMDMYIYNSYQDSLIVDQYISSEIDLIDKTQGIKINQTSDFPHKGYSKIDVIDSKNNETTIYFRIPSWDKNMKIELNGSKIDYEIVNGYAKINKNLQKGDVIELSFDFSPRYVRTNPNVRYNVRRACLFRGPILYCLEEKDNGKDLNKLILNTNNNFDEKDEKISSENIISLTANGFKFKDSKDLYLKDKPDIMEASLKFIPYYCWSNRGENEMLVWVNEN
ncbi:glycoside hydrolase family 127 protein [Pelagibacteraceae bacterium]|nr:glycoside hydrolase family 127 protein [Pelagibacteraceae bacterium]